jgi:hypothetical protein
VFGSGGIVGGLACVIRYVVSFAMHLRYPNYKLINISIRDLKSTLLTPINTN